MREAMRLTVSAFVSLNMDAFGGLRAASWSRRALLATGGGCGGGGEGIGCSGGGGEGEGDVGGGGGEGMGDGGGGGL